MGKTDKITRDDIPLTISQLAALLGVSQVTVSSWIGDGPGALKRDQNGDITLSMAGDWIRNQQIKKTSASRGRREFPYAPEGWGPLPKMPEPGEDGQIGHGPGATKDQVEIRVKIAQAEKIETENEVRAGTLVPVDETVEAWRTILGRVRTRLLKIPTSLAPLVHGDPDMLSIQAKLKEGVNDALSEASEDWREERKESEDE